MPVLYRGFGSTFSFTATARRPGREVLEEAEIASTMYWGENLVSVIHMLPDSCGAIVAGRFRSMKITSAPSAPAHRNPKLGANAFLSNMVLFKPISKWKRLNPDHGDPKSRFSSILSSPSSRICESLVLQCKLKEAVLSKGCIRDVRSASKPAFGLSRRSLWTSVADRLFHERSPSGWVASVKGESDNDSTSPSSSFRENLLNDDGEDGEGGEEEYDVDHSNADGGLEGREMQLAEDAHRLLDTNPKSKEVLESGLYLVGTPIGNLEDITLRAIRVLQSATCILAEDTRHSSKLLQRYGISTPTMSYHKFNEHARRGELVQRLQRGEVLALISDAGMPGISDPGSELVKACVEKNLKVFPIPGPSAALTALVASGLPTEEFAFVGFLSAQAGSRQKRLLAASRESATLIFYVPPQKLCRVLDDFISTFGASRRCAIAREMTKLHEEFWRSTLREAKAEFEVRQPRGEVTLVVEGLPAEAAEHQATKENLISRLKVLIDAGKGPSEASKLVVEETAARRNVVYSLALDISKTLK